MLNNDFTPGQTYRHLTTQQDYKFTTVENGTYIFDGPNECLRLSYTEARRVFQANMVQSAYHQEGVQTQ